MSTAAADVGAVEQKTPEDAELVLANLTNKRLVLHSTDGLSVVLAPFERRTLKATTIERLQLDPLRAQNVVELQEPPAADTRGFAAFGGAFWGAVLWMIVGFATGAALWYWIGGGVLLILLAFVGWRAASSGAVGRWLAQLGALIVVLVVGIGIPGAAIVFGTSLWDVFDTALNGEAIQQDRAVLTLLGRALQLLFIAGVTLLPGLLYFLFDRARLGTLRDRFTRQIFRLDRNVQTCADVQAKYGSIVDEAYGPPQRTSVRLQPGTQWPILVATVVIALGWILTLLNPEVEVVRKSHGLTALFEPWSSPVAYAFLGAYFFALYAALRGYVRGDLRPKTYSYIAVRVIVAFVLAWVLEVALPANDSLLVFAFLVGVIPDTALYRFREITRTGAAGKRALSPLVERLQLTNLDGVDLYDRARLETEGVTNIESLAHHDLVDLMLQTRIPVARLVDWTDQAILYLHLGIDSDSPDDKGRSSLDLLRRTGIRTATDLEQAYAAAVARGKTDEKEFLDTLPPEGDGKPARLRIILDTLADEEWMDALRYWRDPAHLREETLHHPEGAKA